MTRKKTLCPCGACAILRDARLCRHHRHLPELGRFQFQEGDLTYKKLYNFKTGK